MAERYDVAILGAGLAGSTLAAKLAANGRRVVLFERGELPRDKLCGEFLSPETRRIAESLGFLRELEAVGPPAIDRARFFAGSGRTIALKLPGAGFGLSRRVLDDLLFRRARAAGAEVHLRTEVEAVEGGERVRARGQEVTASWVVGTFGRRAKLDRTLGRSSASEEAHFAGLKRHHHPSPAITAALTGHVEIHVFDGGYCGMSLVEGGIVNVCMLVARDFVRDTGGEIEAVRAALAKKSPSLAQRLDGLIPHEATETQAVAEVPFGRRELYKDGILYAGDAAGMIAPLAGDGQAMAIEGASMLADLILAAPRAPSSSDRDALGAHWASTWSRRFGLRFRLAAALQRRLLDPKRAERLFATVGAVPGLASMLAKLTRG